MLHEGGLQWPRGGPDPLLVALREEVREVARRLIAVETRLDALHAFAVAASLPRPRRPYRRGERHVQS